MAKIFITDFEELWNGVTIEAKAIALGFIDERETPDGFRWLQTVITDDPLPGKTLQSVDNGFPQLAQPFYFNYKAFEIDPRMFADSPDRNLPVLGRKIAWNATLTLVAVDLKEQYLVAHDIRTYGFTLRRKWGNDVGEVELVKPRQDWLALQKQIDIVKRFYPAWTFSMLKYEGRVLTVSKTSTEYA